MEVMTPQPSGRTRPVDPHVYLSPPHILYEHYYLLTMVRHDLHYAIGRGYRALWRKRNETAGKEPEPRKTSWVDRNVATPLKWLESGSPTSEDILILCR
jgi:hypothetical protein